MASTKLIETCIDDLVTRLTATMAAKLTALNTEYGDFTLDDIVTYSKSELIEVEKFPTCEVVGLATTILSEDYAMATFRHDIGIIITVSDDTNPGRLREKVYRYARAVYEILDDWRKATGADANSVEFPEPAIDFGAAIRNRRTSQVLADAMVNVRLVKSEAR